MALTQEQIEKFRKLATSTNELARTLAIKKLKEAGISLDEPKTKAEPKAEPKIEKKGKLKLPKKEKESKEEPKKMKLKKPEKVEMVDDGEPSCDDLLEEYHQKEKDKLKRAKEKKDKPKPTAKTIVGHKVESVTGLISKEIKKSERNGKIDEEQVEKAENLLAEIEDNVKVMFANIQSYSKKGEIKKLSKINSLMRSIANV